MTRAERKAIRNAGFKAAEQQRQTMQAARDAYRKAHPVSSGLVPVVTYTPPGRIFAR